MNWVTMTPADLAAEWAKRMVEHEARRADRLVLSPRAMRLLSRMAASDGVIGGIEPYASEARAYLAKKERRRHRMARKKRRGWA